METSLKISTLFPGEGGGGCRKKKLNQVVLKKIKLGESFWLFMEIKKEKKRKNENKKPKTATNKHNQTATNSEVTRKCLIYFVCFAFP